MRESAEKEEERTDKPEGGSKKRWNWGMFLVALVLILVIWGLSAPMILTSRKASERTMAINHAKQIGLALLEFDQEYGSFPDERTAAMVKNTTGTDLDLSGRSSNALFRQLIAFGRKDGGSPGGIEQLFFVPEHPECRKSPDGDVSPGKALEPGEVVWSYIMHGPEWAQNTSANPGRAVLAAPMKIGTEEFWPEPYGDKGVVLRLDNSVEAPLIRKEDGKLPVGEGKTLFDVGEDTVWGADGKIDIRHPEPGR